MNRKIQLNQKFLQRLFLFIILIFIIVAIVLVTSGFANIIFGNGPLIYLPIVINNFSTKLPVINSTFTPSSTFINTNTQTPIVTSTPTVTPTPTSTSTPTSTPITTPSLMEEYNLYFSSNPDVANATINSFNTDEIFYFWQYITELELSGHITIDPPLELQNCEEFDYCLDIFLSDIELNQVIAAKAAHSIWLDKNNMLPWNLKIYSSEDLKGLYDNAWIMNGIAFHSVVDYSPSDIYNYVLSNNLIGQTPQESIVNVLNNLRSTDSQINFLHSGSDEPMDTAYSLYDALTTYVARCNCRIARKGCHSMTRITLGVLRSMNIPGYDLYNFDEEYYFNGHSSAVWPALELVMPHGDDIYNGGLMATPSEEFLVLFSFYNEAEHISVCGENNACLSSRHRAILGTTYISENTRYSCCNPEWYGFSSCTDYLTTMYGQYLTSQELFDAISNIESNYCPFP
jgi:hypothetical protein